MANDCEFCLIAQGQLEGEEIYNDDQVIAVLHLKPAAPGQIILFSKAHYAILEQVPDQLIAHTFSIANKMSIALFETTGAQGTNIIIENGIAANQAIPHFSVNIIPRKENDGLNFQWEPQKLSNDEMDVAAYQIKEQMEKGMTPVQEQEKEMTKNEEKKQDKTEGKGDSKKEGDHRLRQLRRVP